LNEQALARIRLLESTSVSSTEALASSVKTLESQMLAEDGSPLLARVEFAMETQAKASGYLAGKIALRAIAGNIITGMTILSATGAGEDISDITFNAANLKVTDGVTTGYPFQVTGGAVRVKDLQLVPSDVDGLGALATADSVTYASITGTKPPTDADSTSGALLGGININSGGVTLSGTATIKSADYVAGSAGWAINYTGAVDFRSGTVGGFTIGSNFLGTDGAVEIHGAPTPYITVGLTTTDYSYITPSSVSTTTVNCSEINIL
jgi:hypothetical protein